MHAPHAIDEDEAIRNLLNDELVEWMRNEPSTRPLVLYYDNEKARIAAEIQRAEEETARIASQARQDLLAIAQRVCDEATLAHLRQLDDLGTLRDHVLRALDRPR